MTEIVTVDQIHHRYGTHVALRGVTFAIEQGACYGLLGPNGSGKTTLFKILTTLLTPSDGTASVCGLNVVRERDGVRGHIGVVFQSPSLDVHLTTEENLRHAGHLYGLSGRDLTGRIGEVLCAMDIADRASDRIKNLSGGLRRRVELAKCLLHRPSLLILDEPSTGLDPRARKDLWQHLRALLAEYGVSILATTHFLDEADRCDRLAIFDRGRLVAEGKPLSLKQRIGGDCITFTCENPADLKTRIAAEIGGEPFEVDGAVRIETRDGPAAIGRVMKCVGDEVHSVTLGKPTLEDVFIRETGRRFDDEPSEKEDAS